LHPTPGAALAKHPCTQLAPPPIGGTAVEIGSGVFVVVGSADSKIVVVAMFVGSGFVSEVETGSRLVLRSSSLWASPETARTKARLSTRENRMVSERGRLEAADSGLDSQRS
jgi:hypothetical protein